MNKTPAKRNRLRTPNNHTTTGYRISDELWTVLQPLLPVHVNTHRFGGGRPRVADRRCADTILYMLRTGCQWQARDQTELCAHSTAHDRFQVWVEAGVFLKLWQAGVEQFDGLCGIDWNWLAMDGAIAKAPLGGEKTGPNPTDRGKSGVKRSVLTEGQIPGSSRESTGQNCCGLRCIWRPMIFLPLGAMSQSILWNWFVPSLWSGASRRYAPMKLCDYASAVSGGSMKMCWCQKLEKSYQKTQSASWIFR